MTAQHPEHTEQAWREFRAAREAELTEPFGWLTLRGFDWLPSTPARLEGLPGTWSADSEQATVTAAAADGLLLDGRPLEGSDTRTVAEAGRTPWVRFADEQVELMRRGGRLCVRRRAETSPARDDFAGVPTYPFDPDWVVEATMTSDRDEQVEVPTFREDLRQQVRTVGTVDFTLDGQPQQLVVTRMKFGLGVEFHDPTNGTETPAWRQLRFDDPDEQGRVVLDFNRAIDMWFAFTEYATCPAPVEANRLTVPVTAGEKLPA